MKKVYCVSLSGLGFVSIFKWTDDDFPSLNINECEQVCVNNHISPVGYNYKVQNVTLGKVDYVKV